MNKPKLKTYAPAARRDFIRAVTDRAHLLGLSEGHSEPIQVSGEVALIGGRAYPKKIAAQRQGLEARIRREGFGQVMEAVAYTWFNRFAALRYMELHGYLDHGYRVLSHPAGTALPEILEQATSVQLPGLPQAQVIELKLAGNQDAELYRRLLVAQCNALAAAMPFLFERIDDETELLLPDNLLHSDSLIRKLVGDIDAADWQQVEIIGWLYQFYISEKKDQVIGKVVKSEDIPAATQLFTPNWIVQYLVQNSVGRLWLMANPGSALKAAMPYYIEPAEQSESVGAALAAITQARMDEDGGTLNPESITVLDPACGSGHILVEAYEVLKAIYLERGYQPRAIPRLILENNLYGLDIDDRAAQLAGFALLMKARADDRRLLENAPQLHVFSLQESKGLDAAAIAQALLPSPTGGGAGGEGKSVANVIRQLIDLFTHAKTFGSLIQIPASLAPLLPTLAEALKLAASSDDLHARAAAEELLPLVRQAQILAMKFDAVVANPPYMGGKGMNAALKEYAKATFPDSKSDLFAMFIERGFGWCKPMGFNSMVTMQSWMFLSSYEEMRKKLLHDRTIFTMAHLGARAFSEISGEVVQTTTFVLHGQHLSGYKPAFFRLVEGQDEQKEMALRTGQFRYDATVQDDFGKVPGSPLAYWVGNNVRNAFERMSLFRELGNPKVGMQTSNNSRYLRYWWEVDFVEVKQSDISEMPKWITYLKGGPFRRWYGNFEYLLRYNGAASYILAQPNATVLPLSRLNDPKCSWTDLTSGAFNCRLAPNRSFHDISGHCFYPKKEDQFFLLGATNAKPFNYLLSLVNATFHYQVGDVGKIPVPQKNKDKIGLNVEELVALSKDDWDSHETSWDFYRHSWTKLVCPFPKLSVIWPTFCKDRSEVVKRTQELEEENNRLFINAYGLQDELSPEVPEDQITLARADREKDCQRLISYAIGCMMGRYSLDEPGLIYAHAGNVGFDPARYATFHADADGIVPLTDEPWFPDDAAQRIREFLIKVWGAETLEENLAWLAESLGKKASETPEETLRRYLADTFFKNHLQTYKKRPIYWLFSSGKQGAFQALVYLHRYHEGTLARMRGEYVVPLQGKLAARTAHLQDEIAAAPSTAARNKLQKQLDALKKKQTELIAYDDLLRHYADQRIPLDLDDGVKVNYGKFGNLLAEVKAVTGGAGDD
ncbi:MAG: BREX-1 system adenine-specific DNA-methyltransferase PglX [Pseudomonadota bacterium]|nr:BREX-1 system adenine-specific DNA-methyltransferase PglX [Pseudomonadota bacterium]MDP1902710.1 BREX-1 system adenine-specific DNA-methyltransferase PglX [Pseudomonadota bacterium]MDP2354117.1 BREX-1 system adenine-specific DNA-methyltransferase PglX [Pseudomonadota bacterium]